jgi:hypothetical protein
LSRVARLSPAAGVDDIATGEPAEQPTGADVDDA